MSTATPYRLQIDDICQTFLCVKCTEELRFSNDARPEEIEKAKDAHRCKTARGFHHCPKCGGEWSVADAFFGHLCTDTPLSDTPVRIELPAIRECEGCGRTFEGVNKDWFVQPTNHSCDSLEENL